MRPEVLYPLVFALSCAGLLATIFFLLYGRGSRTKSRIVAAWILIYGTGVQLIWNFFELLGQLLDGRTEWTLWVGLTVLNWALSNGAAWWFLLSTRRSARGRQEIETGN